MKKFLILALLALVAVEAEETGRAVEPRYKLLGEVAGRIIDLLTENIKAHTKVFENLIEAGKTSEHKDETEFEMQLNQFAALIESMKKIEAEDEDSLHKTLRLFTIYENIEAITEKYDITNSRLPPVERLVAELLKDAGLYKAQLQFYQNLLAASRNVTTLVQSYYNGLSEADKMKELKMMNWLKKTEAPQTSPSNINTLFEFFDIYA